MKKIGIAYLLVTIFTGSFSVQAMEEGYCLEVDPLWMKVHAIRKEHLKKNRQSITIASIERTLTVVEKQMLWESLTPGSPHKKFPSIGELYSQLDANKDKPIDIGSEKESLLHKAVRLNNIHVVIILIAVGAEAHVRRTEDSKSPLHLACEMGQLDMIKLLVWAGGQKNSIDSNGNTPAQIIRKHLNEAKKYGTYNNNDKLIERFVAYYGWLYKPGS